MPSSQGDATLGGLCSLWIEKIRKASEHKKKQFQDDADEAMSFYRPPDGNYGFVYRGDLKQSKGVGIDVAEPSMQMTLNKVAELVEIFGPILYAKNPIRQVNPRQLPGIPPFAIPNPGLYQFLMAQEAQKSEVDMLKCVLISTYLNWTPNELRLKEHAERGIDEAIIKGRGCLWCGTLQPPGNDTKFVGSFYDSVDFLYIDPDAESLENAWWIARQVCQPVWEVERRFGIKEGTLKGSAESANKQVEVDSAKKEYDRQRGLTNDLITYYEIYSRMGCGGRLSGSDRQRNIQDHGILPGDLAGYAATLDPLVGDFVYLVVAPGVDYPLNLPPDVQDVPMTMDGSPNDGAVQVKQRLSWPIPFWADKQWPVSVLDFHPVPRSAWPMSHIKPALGELRFLCWAYSFVACKIKNTLRDIVAVLKEMADQFKLTVLEGADLSMVELDTNNRDIKECVQVLQFPQMNADIWKIIEAVETNFDKRVGLNEIFYGKSQRQDRSATESDIKSQSMNIRPDDMSERVETWMTEAARKEAIAARMLLAPKDVLPVLGLTASALWLEHVASKDLGIFRELEYRIEAGSTKKPNRDRDQANADSSMQILLPIFNQFAMGTGQLGPINALISFWAKTRDIVPGPFLLPSPPPPVPGAAPGQPGQPPPEDPQAGSAAPQGGPAAAPGGPS